MPCRCTWLTSTYNPLTPLSLSPLRCPKADTQSHSPIRSTRSPDNKQKSNVHSKSQHSVCYNGVSTATPLEHDYCTTTSSSRHGEREGGGRRQRKGTGSSGQVWDLRMKLDHRAASREGESADHRDRGSSRREKRRGGLLFIALSCICCALLVVYFL